MLYYLYHILALSPPSCVFVLSACIVVISPVRISFLGGNITLSYVRCFVFSHYRAYTWYYRTFVISYVCTIIMIVSYFSIIASLSHYRIALSCNRDIARQTTLRWPSWNSIFMVVCWGHQIIVLSYYRTIVLSYYRTIVLSYYPTILLSYCHTIYILLFYYRTVILSYMCPMVVCTLYICYCK